MTATGSPDPPVERDELVRAAGVVVLRAAHSGDEVLTVHRPHRADWSLPKGKLEPGESVVAAAVRECDEETGYRVTLGARLPAIEYQALGKPKRVDYWVASIAQDEGFIPHDEIDEIRWVPVTEASTLLTYEHDARLVAHAAALPTTSPLIILRHTQAVKRADYRGKSDAERPLSGRGRSQARATVPLLESFGVHEVYSSPFARCHQSVRRLAKALGVVVQHDPAFSEEGHATDPDRTTKRTKRLLRNPAPLVLCTHRPVLPTVLRAISEHGDVDPSVPPEMWEPRMPPGSFVVVHRDFSVEGAPRILSVERHGPSLDE